AARRPSLICALLRRFDLSLDLAAADPGAVELTVEPAHLCRIIPTGLRLESLLLYAQQVTLDRVLLRFELLLGRRGIVRRPARRDPHSRAEEDGRHHHCKRQRYAHDPFTEQRACPAGPARDPTQPRGPQASATAYAFSTCTASVQNVTDSSKDD